MYICKVIVHPFGWSIPLFGYIRVERSLFQVYYTLVKDRRQPGRRGENEEEEEGFEKGPLLPEKPIEKGRDREDVVRSSCPSQPR